VLRRYLRIRSGRGLRAARTQAENEGAALTEQLVAGRFDPAVGLPDGKRFRSWALIVVAILLALVAAIFLSTSIAWPGSQNLSVPVAVNTAVNINNSIPNTHQQYRISAGHSHGPPASVNALCCGEQTYYVVAGDTPVLVHNCGGRSGPATPEDHVPIFRNVDANEFDSIATTGEFRLGPGQNEGKWFATQGAHADEWGNRLNGGQGLTVQTTIPRSLYNQLFARENLDGIGRGVFADADQLAAINRQMTGIRLWPF
jgi:hypothetical protein